MFVYAWVVVTCLYGELHWCGGGGVVVVGGGVGLGVKGSADVWIVVCG